MGHHLVARPELVSGSTHAKSNTAAHKKRSCSSLTEEGIHRSCSQGNKAYQHAANALRPHTF